MIITGQGCQLAPGKIAPSFFIVSAAAWAVFSSNEVAHSGNHGSLLGRMLLKARVELDPVEQGR